MKLLVQYFHSKCLIDRAAGNPCILMQDFDIFVLGAHMEKMPMPSWDDIKSLITSILSKQATIIAIACIKSEVMPDSEHLKELTFESDDPAASFDRIFMAFRDIIALKEELSDNSGQQKEPLSNVKWQEKPLNKGKQ